MKSPSTQVSMSAGAAGLAIGSMMSLMALPLAASLVLAAMIAIGGFVAFAAQSRRLSDEERLVYRPVYVYRQDVHKRVRSDDD